MKQQNNKSKQKIEREPQGTPTLTSKWAEKIIDVNPESVQFLQDNIHCRDALNNIMRYVFQGHPEIWVTDADEETDADLTAETIAEFERLKCYQLMQASLADHWTHGAFIHSDGISKEGGVFKITEIRHLPPSTFAAPPNAGYQYTIPNPLLPGIVINREGEAEIWQTDPINATQTKIENAQCEPAHGTAAPAGEAYLYPVYFAIAQIDFASKAEVQQLNRIGAPPLLPKAVDNIDPARYQQLNKWFSQFLARWGKDTSALLPPGIEFPTLNIKEGTVAERFIQSRIDWIRTYANPISDLQQRGSGIGTSDSGRMEIWASYITAEQSACETWLEELFNYVLAANGYEGYHTHIKLKRPSVDKAALRLQYIQQAYNSHAITTREIRDNMTDILDLPEWTPELEQELLNQYQNQSAANLFGNVQRALASQKEEKIMQETGEEMQAVMQKLEDAILQIINPEK